LQEAFPITGRGFIPVKELEAKNGDWIRSIKRRIIEDQRKRKKEAEEAEKPEEL